MIIDENQLSSAHNILSTRNKQQKQPPHNNRPKLPLLKASSYLSMGHYAHWDYFLKLCFWWLDFNFLLKCFNEKWKSKSKIFSRVDMNLVCIALISCEITTTSIMFCPNVLQKKLLIYTINNKHFWKILLCTTKNWSQRFKIFQWK